MQDADSLGRNGKSEGILESFFFFFERMGLMVGRGGEKSKTNNSKGETYCFLNF